MVGDETDRDSKFSTLSKEMFFNANYLYLSLVRNEQTMLELEKQQPKKIINSFALFEAIISC